MTSDRWQQIKAIFQAAADIAASDRTAYLDEACANEPELRREVEALLAASEDAGDFIEKPALHHSAVTLAVNAADPSIGRRVGPYRVAGEIGSGGMGTVYRAVRDDDHFRQEVAIKIVKRGMDTAYILRRFRNERQILASLEHPNIARLLDGGATEDGLPYYVMEYIEGRPIDQFCDSRKLSTLERLSLFVPVCAAVHSAHQKMVVHRDIKPWNILVTKDGVPKLLDFGIAKILDPEMSAQPGDPTITETAMRMMTPAYASPEQIRGEAITPASDVYSLGVLLYELLTGHRPYRFKSRTPYEMAHVICEEDPERPSAAVGRTETITVGENRILLTPQVVSRTRDGEPKKLRQSLEGDLDCIVLMAMRKDPLRRYASAEEFATDIRRYIEGEPVVARGDTATYRFGKWVTKRKASTAIAAAGVIVALAAALAWQVNSARPPVAPAAAARVKMRPSVAVLGFKNLSKRPQAAWLSTALTEMLTTELAAGEQLHAISGETVGQVKLDLSLSEADSFGRETLARIRTSLGADYVVVGSYLATGAGETIRLDLRLQDAAAGETMITASERGSETNLPDLVSRAGARVRESLGAGSVSGSEAGRTRASPPATAEASREYFEGVQRLRIFDTVAAKEHLERAAAADPNHALTHSALALALSSLGDDARATEAAKKAFDLSKDLPREMRLFVEGRYYETINSWDKAGDIYHALYGFFPDNLDYGLRLVAARINSGNGREALRTLEDLRRLPPPAPDDPRLDVEEAGAAELISDYKRELAAAIRASAKGKAQGSRILVARAKLLEGRAYASLGQPDKAIQSLEESKTLYGQFGHRRGAARAVSGIAFAKLQRGDTVGASKLYEESLAIFREIGNKSGTAATLQSLAMIRAREGQLEAAQAMYRESIALRRELGERGAMASALHGLAVVLLDSGSVGEAKMMVTEAHSIDRELGDKRMIARDQSGMALTSRYEGDLASARNLYQDSITLRRQVSDEASLPGALQEFSHLLQDQGDMAGGKKAAQEALVIARKLGAGRDTSSALAGLGWIALAEDELTSAKKYLSESLSLRSEVGGKNLEARSLLAMAQWNMEEGRPDIAEPLAVKAVTAFHHQKAVHLEVATESLLALSQAMQKKFVEAQSIARHTSQLLPKVEFRQIRLSSGTNLARVEALLGRPSEAAKRMEPLLAEATQLGLVPHQFEIRLALGEAAIQSGEAAKGRALLAAVRSDASLKGYRLIARKAAAALERR